MSEGIPIDLAFISMALGFLTAGVFVLIWRLHVFLNKDHPAEIRNGVVYPVRRRR